MFEQVDEKFLELCSVLGNLLNCVVVVLWKEM